MADRIEENLIELTEKLISFKTVPGNIEAQRNCLHFIGQYLQGVSGLHYSAYTNRDQPYLVISSQDTKNRTY